jgi:hypothetical protein
MIKFLPWLKETAPLINMCFICLLFLFYLGLLYEGFILTLVIFSGKKFMVHVAKKIINKINISKKIRIICAYLVLLALYIDLKYIWLCPFTIWLVLQEYIDPVLLVIKNIAKHLAKYLWSFWKNSVHTTWHCLMIASLFVCILTPKSLLRIRN